MVDRWTYGSRIKSLHPSRYTSEGEAANLPLFPPGARNLRPSVDPPRSPPTTSPVVPTPGNPPKVTPQVSPPGTSDVPPKCVPHNIPRGIFHLPPREAVKSEAGGEIGVKDLVRPPITSEETVKLEGILKTTPKYQGLPKADPEAQRIDSARNPQFRQSGPIGAPKQAQNTNMCSNDAEIVNLSKRITNEQKGGVPPIERWRAKIFRRKARRLQRAMDTVEEANLLLDGMEANLAHLEAQ